MKCDDVRSFFYQLATKSLSTQVAPADLDFFHTNGYLSLMDKEEYDQGLAEVSSLTQMTGELQNEEQEERSSEDALDQEKKKTHSIMFHLEGGEKKETELSTEESEEEDVSKRQADIAEKDSEIQQLLQKKSMLDRVVPYGAMYLALTGLGVLTLNDLIVRNYRVSDVDFSDYIAESKETSAELQGIVDRGSFYVSSLGSLSPQLETGGGDDDDQALSQVWSVSIGLAKLQGDQYAISRRFLSAFDLLDDFKSTLENKMMAAEIMTASTADLQSLAASLDSLDDQLRHDAKVPKELSAGIAATIMAGVKFDGTYPTSRFVDFCKVTSSFESAAILSVSYAPLDELSGKFQAYRSLFSSWGYAKSEDTELASAYLSISDFGPDDVKDKMSIILDALKNYLQYPVVAGAILTSIPTLEANETLDLMEKAYSMLASVAKTLQRSELVSLAVLMVHGIRNEIVGGLDSTAKAATSNTPVQFANFPYNNFLLYYLILAHSSYYATFSGIGGAHPAHAHGVGGFMG